MILFAEGGPVSEFLWFLLHQASYDESLILELLLLTEESSHVQGCVIWAPILWDLLDRTYIGEANIIQGAFLIEDWL